MADLDRIRFIKPRVFLNAKMFPIAINLLALNAKMSLEVN